MREFAPEDACSKFNEISRLGTALAVAVAVVAGLSSRVHMHSAGKTRRTRSDFNALSVGFHGAGSKMRTIVLSVLSVLAVIASVPVTSEVELHVTSLTAHQPSDRWRSHPPTHGYFRARETRQSVASIEPVTISS